MGHGHVIPNADGSRARCGGPGLCDECGREAAQKEHMDMHEGGPCLCDPPPSLHDLLSKLEARIAEADRRVHTHLLAGVLHQCHAELIAVARAADPTESCASPRKVFVGAYVSKEFERCDECGPCRRVQALSALHDRMREEGGT